MIKNKLTLYSDTAARTSISSLAPALREVFSNVEEADTKTFIQKIETRSSDILVIPGITGESSRYFDLLGGENGQRKLKSFVEEGGILISICAGSYLIARETAYQPPWGPEKTRTNPAALFNALARGPVATFGKEPANNNWYSDVSVVNISYKDGHGKWKPTGIMYGNGPALYPFEADPDLETLAHYTDSPDAPIAAAWKPVGHGAVLWLGVLPYIGYEPIEDYPYLEKLTGLMQQLQPHETSRREFWQSLVSRIDKHINNLSSRPFSGLGLPGPKR